MKLTYIFPKRFKANVANRIQTLHQAHAFTKLLGDNFRFLTCDGYNEAALQRLGLAAISSMIQMSCPSLLVKKQYLFWLKLLCTKKIQKDHIIYIRDYDSLRVLSYLKQKGWLSNTVIIETHELPEKPPVISALANTDAMVAISSNLARDMATGLQYRQPLLVAHDGFHPEQADNLLLPEEIERFCASCSRETILYTGTYHAWKNIEFLVEAANIDPTLRFAVFGVSPSRLQVTPRYGNIVFFPFLEHRYMGTLLRKFTYAIVTTSSSHAISRYTSPLKLFEYLACGCTVFAPDTPNMREIITDQQTGYLYDNNDSHRAVHQLRAILAARRRLDPAAIAGHAMQFSWDKRAEKIVALAATLGSPAKQKQL